MLRYLFVLSLLLTVMGCHSQTTVRRASLPPPQTLYTLGPGDKFQIKIIGEEKFPEEYTIASDGTVDFPYLHRQNVVGFEAQDLATHVKQLLVEGQFIRDPVVIVSVKEYNSKRVMVNGAVSKPGEVPFTPNLTMMRAIAAVGGFTQQADRSTVVITRKVQGGSQAQARFRADDIAEGNASDVPLQAGDNIYVYERNFLAESGVMAVVDSSECARRKVMVLHTGGTLMMRPGNTGALEPDAYAHDLVRELPVLSRIASIEARVVCNLDSGDMQPEDWVSIARAVHAEVSNPEIDGVVVVHGTDTMAYTASAVALMLGPLPKPVMFTGAQRPLAEARTDARSNLVDACHVATMPVPEVGIVFSSKCFRAVRATKRDAWALSAFDSLNLASLVDLGLGESIGGHVRAPGALGGLDDRLDRRVLAVRVFPGLDPEALLRALASGTRGLVLEGYGTGNLPHLSGSLIPVIEDAARRKVPVVVVSQCLRGQVDLARYAGGAAAEKAGAISGGDMTAEAALVKLMIALGRYSDIAQIRRFMESDIVGERS